MLEKIDTDDAEVHEALFENFIDAIFVTDDKIEVRLFVCFKNAKVLYNDSCVCAENALYGLYKKKRLPYRSHKR